MNSKLDAFLRYGDTEANWGSQECWFALYDAIQEARKRIHDLETEVCMLQDKLNKQTAA